MKQEAYFAHRCPPQTCHPEQLTCHKASQLLRMTSLWREGEEKARSKALRPKRTKNTIKSTLILAVHSFFNLPQDKSAAQDDNFAAANDGRNKLPASSGL